jgi:cyclophilin family peptidyl-prolyl cis-trans isomerase
MKVHMLPVFLAFGPLMALGATPDTAGGQAPGNPVVIIETSVGDITAELYKDKAPRSVENFLAYVNDGFYSGTVFHRVIKGFMIQGGGLTADLSRKQTRAAIANEATNGLKNARGTLAMARTGEVNSATSQFFINTVDNRPLDHRGQTPDAFGYAVFGKVIAGMDVVDKIEATKTTTQGPYRDVPAQPIVINSVRVKP